MKVEFLVENIESFLPLLSKTLPAHTQIPVLSNILLEAKGNGFFLYATDLELGVRVKIPAKIDEEGSITIPGKQFIEALSSLPKGKVELSLDKDLLTLSSQDNKITFNTIVKEEFPSLFEEKGVKIGEFSKNEVERIFSKVIFAVSLDEARPELTGVLLSQKHKGLDFVATDGFRLSLKKEEGKALLDDGETLILSSKLIQEVLFSKEEDNMTLYLQKKGNQVLFESKNILLVGRLINGEFPNYEKVIPSQNKTKITFETEEFLQKIRLSSIFARESANIVKLKIEDKRVKIFAKSSGLGEGEASLDVEQEGDDNEIAFNVKFLLDLLKNIESKRTTMEINSPLESAVFKTDEDKNFIHIIMPVRVQE